MDRVAEEGIAAHWSYKEDKSFNQKEDTAFVWIRQLLDWNSSMKDSEEFLTDLKVDLFDEEVFVFTPKGEVKELVKGATVLDFAYSVHSGLGDSCIGAKVNGKWVTLKYELKNGDIVEILRGPNQHPVVDWLKFVKTTKAKNRIRHWLRTNTNVEENADRGRSLLEKKLKRFNLTIDTVPHDVFTKIIELNSLRDLKDLLAGIGNGEFSEFKIANAIRKLTGEKTAQQEGKPEAEYKPKTAKGEILVQGEFGDITYKFAKCCNPVPGDIITGVFTKKGISIHRINCQNLNINKLSAPMVQVSWNKQLDNYYVCRFKVNAKNRDGLINDIVNTVTKNGAFLNSVTSNGNTSNHLEADLMVKVRDQAHVNEIISSLKKVKGILDVEREG
jgi:GTP pyrophosphokinase